MDSEDLVAQLSLLVERKSADKATRICVAIDGPDAAGKTTLADLLVVKLRTRAAVLRSSIDNWANPSNVRYRRGRESPEGYYFDSFDLARLRRDLLDPFALGGDGRCRLVRQDHKGDLSPDVLITVADERCVLLFDGVFLLRPELSQYWDLSIYLHVNPRSLSNAGSRVTPGTWAARQSPEISTSIVTCEDKRFTRCKRRRSTRQTLWSTTPTSNLRT